MNASKASHKCSVLSPKRPIDGTSTRPAFNLSFSSWWEYLYEHEVEVILNATKTVVHHGHRDATLILLAYWNGLRVTELVNLQWQQVKRTGY